MIRNFCIVLLASAAAAVAHPGHDAALAEGSGHWLTQPDHWIVLALGALVAADLVRRAVRSRARARRERQTP